MARKRTLQARLSDLIAEFGLDAVVQAMMMAEQLGKPPKAKKEKSTRKEQEGFVYQPEALE